MAKVEELAIVFGKKLSKLLDEKKISHNKLAQEIGIDRASITKYVKGESAPRLDTFLAICDALQVQPNYFLNAEYDDYSADNSKTEERKIIESLYCLCKSEIITKYSDNGYVSTYNYVLRILEGSLLDTVLLECLRYAGSDLADDVEMCKKIVDKYEPLFIEYLKKE
ncbi:MAG: helix-turn-helix transcriptional regulator [Bacilli bacterium]|nr:helix-turn-helix transcriptional regulator [Bacilli bacterium]